MGTHRLRSVDGIRGIAILFIVLYHFRLLAKGAAPQSDFLPLLEPARKGGLWISLFVILSGFGLTYSLLGKARTGKRLGFVRYEFERWKRLAPPYYAALGLYLTTAMMYAAVAHRGPAVGSGLYRQVIVHLLFMHGLWRDTIYAISIPLWFLSMLFQLYLIFPVLVAIVERMGYVFAVPLLIVAAVIWRFALVLTWPDYRYLINGLFLGFLPQFTIGMAIAAWYHGFEPTRMRRSLDLLYLPASLVAIGALPTAAPNETLSLFLDTCWGAAFGALLVAILVSDRYEGAVSRFCQAAPLVWAGKIAYSLYLTHDLVFWWAGSLSRRIRLPHTAVADDLFLIVVFAAVLAVGWAFYRMIELPFAQLQSSGKAQEHQEASFDAHGPAAASRASSG